jgi:hypothetical protein
VLLQPAVLRLGGTREDATSNVVVISTQSGKALREVKPIIEAVGGGQLTVEELPTTSPSKRSFRVLQRGHNSIADFAKLRFRVLLEGQAGYTDVCLPVIFSGDESSANVKKKVKT